MAFGIRCKQRADQRQLGLNTSVVTVELQSLAVGLTGQLGVNITEVLMCGGIAWVSTNRHFERSPRLVKLALTRVQNGKIVVRFGQLRIILGDLRKGGDGIGGFACLSLNHAFDKAHLRVAWFGHKVLISLGESL